MNLPDRRCPHCDRDIDGLWNFFQRLWLKMFDCPHCGRGIIGEIIVAYDLRRNEPGVRRPSQEPAEAFVSDPKEWMS